MRVRRLVGAFAPGRVLNPLLARSQLMGGMLWGMSQALLEGNPMDPRTGRWAAGTSPEYLVPVNADAPDVDVEFVDVPTNRRPARRQGRRGDRPGRRRGRDRQRRLPRHRQRVRQLPIAPELVMDPARMSARPRGRPQRAAVPTR